MSDLQVFEMNPPINFPIPDKSIYQMGFNPAPSQPYVHEANPLTSHLQILDLLNPQNPSGSTDKKQELLASLMTPHYEKQTEIEKKIDDLSDVVNQFIKTQQDFNKLILAKVLGTREPSSSPLAIAEEPKIDEMDQEASQAVEVEESIEKESPNETIISQQQTISNPLPVYPVTGVPVPISHDAPPAHSPIRNRSISPEKMETGGEMSVRDFLKNTMTVKKADDKILEEELERERDEAAQAVRYNKFRVRNRPKKYKRSAVTFTSTMEPPTSSSAVPPIDSAPSSSSPIGNQQLSNQLMNPMDQQPQNEIEENIFQPIVIPCVQRAAEIDLSLMQPVFPTTSSYVLNSALDSASHTAQNSLAALADAKFQPDPTNLWKAVDSATTQLLVDAPLLEELRFPDHSHHSSFLPFVHEPAHRSAFVPAQYNKDRRIHQHMDLTDSLRNL